LEFSIDADEAISGELRDSILEAKKLHEPANYRIRQAYQLLRKMDYVTEDGILI